MKGGLQGGCRDGEGWWGVKGWLKGAKHWEGGRCFEVGVAAQKRKAVSSGEFRLGRLWEASKDELGDKERERAVASRRGLRKFKKASENARKKS